MPLSQYTVTLGATAAPAVTAHTPFAIVRVENETGNAAVNFGTLAITSTDYAGTVLAGPAAAVTLGSGTLGIVNLEDLYFLGTNTQKIHLTVFTP